MTKYDAHNQDDFLLKSNLLGAQNMKELEQFEEVAFYLTSTSLEQSGFEFLMPVSPSSVKLLHMKIFGDIYSFAGKTRDTSLMKGTTRFCEPQFIESQLYELCSYMNEETPWKSLEQAAERLAHFKTELNMIHPFREGNGRTIRLVIREYAKSKGFIWDFEYMNDEEYMKSMILSQHDTVKLEKLFLKTLSRIK